MSFIGKYARPPARRIAAPLLRALDVRLDRNAERIEAHTVNLARHHEAINETIVNSYTEGLNTTRALVRTEGEAVGEYVLAMARIEERMTRAVEMAKVEAMPRTLERVDPAAAEYLNWVTSPTGLFAGAGVAGTSPVEVRLSTGHATVTAVDARIVVVPLVHARLATQPSSTIIEVGSAGSLLALELASLGHRVVALDAQPVAVEHPGITAVRADVGSWRGPDAPVDAAVCVAGIDPAAEPLDAAAVQRVASWVRPGGSILLAVLVGRASETAPRVHDRASLAALVDGLEVEARWTFRRTSPTTWAPVPDDADTAATDAAPGVAVVHLRRP